MKKVRTAASAIAISTIILTPGASFASANYSANSNANTVADDGSMPETLVGLGRPEEVLAMSEDEIRERIDSLSTRESAELDAQLRAADHEIREELGQSKVPSTSLRAANGIINNVVTVANMYSFTDSLSQFMNHRAQNIGLPPYVARNPYGYNWGTDGCSVPPSLKDKVKLSAYLSNFFVNACTRHDFSYSNYGKKTKLKLGAPNYADSKSRIDAKFYDDMKFLSNGNKIADVSALAFYLAVRKYGDPAFGL